jgi:hypothetical protein
MGVKIRRSPFGDTLGWRYKCLKVYKRAGGRVIHVQVQIQPLRRSWTRHVLRDNLSTAPPPLPSTPQPRGIKPPSPPP